MKITRRPEWLVLGIICIAANLRAPVTGLPPLIGTIQDDLGLSSTMAGLLTSTPLMVFALISLIGARIGAQFGLERSLFYAIWLILIGILLRSVPSVWLLFIGNNIVAVGIAIGNVLLPGLVKREFPHRIAFLTALYALTMSLVAALVSASAVPISHIDGLNWRYSLLSVGLIALITLVIWWPQWRQSKTVNSDITMPKVFLWCEPLAWQVSLFLGLNSVSFYILVSWLPAILSEAGFTPERAGHVHGLLQLAIAISGLLVVPLIARFKDQRPVVMIMMVPIFIGWLGLVFYPAAALWWSISLGVGGGGIFVLSLSFVGMRVASSQQAASLSGMAQFIGYLLAASGPIIAGKLHDISGNWTSTLIMCLLLATALLVVGLLAGRNIRIEVSTPVSSTASTQWEA